MSYEPTEWKSGDVITSAKLNKIEQGIAAGGTGGGGGAFIVNCSYNGNLTTLDKTWAEISEAAEENVVIFAHPSSVTGVDGILYSTLASCVHVPQAGMYVVDTFYMTPEGNNIYHETYYTQSEDGYPVYTAQNDS